MTCATKRLRALAACAFGLVVGCGEGGGGFGESFGLPTESGGTASPDDGDDGPGSGGSAGDETNGATSMGPTGCVTDEDCADTELETCQVAVCGQSGMCAVEMAEAGTPCGDDTLTDCSNADTCDESGVCQVNNYIDGVPCEGCEVPPCECMAGECGDCTALAAINRFTTDRSTLGWELTGDWALTRDTAHSQANAPADFPNRVLGTDGNRTQPAPGAEVETSYARTTPTELGTELRFQSWHVDEGGSAAADNKTISVSVDGSTWTVLADCATDPTWAFCTPITTRLTDEWDDIVVPVPAELQGERARVEFGYDTVTECCDYDQGWYIDNLEFAGECACTFDADCDPYAGDCATAACGKENSCILTGLGAGMPCGDATDSNCDQADACDQLGYCRDNVQPSIISYCSDCPAGGVCQYCSEGACEDCDAFTDGSDFSDPLSVGPWTVTAITGTAGWGLYDEAPIAAVGGMPIVFPNAPVYGTDGNREPPYPGGAVENSTVVTGPGSVTQSITFNSWNVDEGGSNYDTKIIEISTDNGTTWEVIENCQAGSTQPFCTSVNDRAADDWDAITLDTTPWQGQTGILRFTYNTVDTCCSFERGWYIDDLDFLQTCDDPVVWP